MKLNFMNNKIRVLFFLVMLFICVRTLWLFSMPGDGIRLDTSSTFFTTSRSTMEIFGDIPEDLKNYYTKRESILNTTTKYWISPYAVDEGFFASHIKLLSLPLLVFGCFGLFSGIIGSFDKDIEERKLRREMVFGGILAILLAINLHCMSVGVYFNNPNSFDLSINIDDKIINLPSMHYTNIRISHGIYDVRIFNKSTGKLLFNNNYVISMDQLGQPKYIINILTKNN